MSENFNSKPSVDPSANTPDEPPRYNLYTLDTTGWEIVVIDDQRCENNTKEVSQHFSQVMLDSGVSPDRIKVKRVS